MAETMEVEITIYSTWRRAPEYDEVLGCEAWICEKIDQVPVIKGEILERWEAESL